MNTPENAAVDTTNTQAPAAAPAAPAAPVVPSKMDKAKPLFFGLKDGSIALDEGKSARATFIARAQLPEIGMTKNGAATYWQNLVSLDKGGKLYPHTSTKKTEAAKPADAAPAAETKEEPAGSAAEEVAPAADVKDEDDVSHLAE